MRKVIYTTEVNVYATENGNKTLDRTETWDELHIFADEGKVFKRISTGEVLTAHIGVGSEDDENDFEEIEAD